MKTGGKRNIQIHSIHLERNLENSKDYAIINNKHSGKHTQGHEMISFPTPHTDDIVSVYWGPENKYVATCAQGLDT